MAQPVYRLYLKDYSFFDLAADSGILYDSSRHYKSDGQKWKIIGFGTCHNSRALITLEDAANGQSIGHGFVHDLDHGTHRIWGMPKWRRAIKVYRIAADMD